MSRGGARPGAGRKAGSGTYAGKTVARRLPVSLLPVLAPWIRSWKVSNRLASHSSGTTLEKASQTPSLLSLPLFTSRVSAGFPSHADDFLEASLDLNQYLIQHPAATFFVRTSGDSMINAGIHNNDILVVDRSLQPKKGMVVIAIVNGEFTVKRLHIEGEIITLKPENPDYVSLVITEEMDFCLWGVVTSVIHEFRREI